MSVPSNTVFTQGTGSAPITADNLNTFIQLMPTLAGARGFSGQTSMQIFLQGYVSPNDGGQGNFTWITGTGTDDGGVTTIVPTGNTSGYWSRIVNSSTAYAPQTVNGSGSFTYTAANVANQVLVRSGAAGIEDTFANASAIIPLISGSETGVIRDLLLINANTGTLLILPGTGVTFAGNLATGAFSMSTVTQRLFKIYISSATTVTVYG